MTRKQFIELIAAEQESLRRFLRGLCGGDGFRADDIAQEALLKAYLSYERFEGRSRFSTWLFRIAYNCYIDNHRKARPEMVGTDAPAALNVRASEETDAAFRYQQLYQALDRLSEKEKAAIVLHYFEDRSIKEIASILQIPQGTVKYHLSTGRNHLKSLLQ